MKHVVALLVGVLFLAGCATENDLNRRPEPIGDFAMGHNIVVASKMQMGPVSRKASEEEWKTALTDAMQSRFSRYDGAGLYHFGTSIEGYMLAPVGVPVLYKPKSALIINVTVWNDAEGKKYNDKPHQIMVFEDTDTESFVVGSGATRTKEEQLAGLSFNAAKAVEDWLREMHKEFGWFTPNAVYNPVIEKAPTPSK